MTESANDTRLPDCPDLETLAAYIDDRLDPDTRRAIELHAAGCEVCLELIADTFEAELEDSRAEGAVLPLDDPGATSPWSRRVFRVGAPLAAAAALVMVVWLSQSRQSARAVEAHIEKMRDAIGDRRLVEGRLPGFAHASFVAASRSRASAATNATLTAAALATLQDLPPGAAPSSRRARGVAHLLLNDLDAAVAELEGAAPGGTRDARTLTALSAALLARADHRGSTADLERALDAAVRAIAADAQAAEPRFNQALALEKLGRRDAAIAAWRDVIRLEQSGWTSEAEGRLATLVAEQTSR